MTTRERLAEFAPKPSAFRPGKAPRRSALAGADRQADPSPTVAIAIKLRICATALDEGAARALPDGLTPPVATAPLAGSPLTGRLPTTIRCSLDSTPARVPGGGGSALLVVAPELRLQSDWTRHALTAVIRGSYNDYRDLADRPTLNATVGGRIDVSRDSRVDLEGRSWSARFSRSAGRSFRSLDQKVSRSLPVISLSTA